MNNDKLKFVVDSRSFDGSCVTTMSDGIHGDYHHETLEELRDREKNPYLTAVSGNTVRNRVKNEINEVFTQTVLLLSSKGFISLNVEYIDGSKIIRYMLLPY